jgi:hypothetical protein
MDCDDEAWAVQTAQALHILVSPTFLKLGFFEEWSCPVSAGKEQYARWLIRAEFQVEQVSATGKLNLTDDVTRIATASRGHFVEI